jgi:hypothetical protein
VSETFDNNGLPLPPQVEYDSPVIDQVIDRIKRLARLPGPMVLQADADSRHELLRIFRAFERNETADKVKCQVKLVIDVEELEHLIDGHLHNELSAPLGLCVFLTGPDKHLATNPPRALQELLLKRYADKDDARDMPPVLILVAEEPASLHKQRLISKEFLDLVDGRLVVMPSADERLPADLVTFFQACVHRAAAREHVGYNIRRGGLELLKGVWTQVPPPSLSDVLGGANKIVNELSAMGHSIKVLSGLEDSGRRRIDIMPKHIQHTFFAGHMSSKPRTSYIPPVLREPSAATN